MSSALSRAGGQGGVKHSKADDDSFVTHCTRVPPTEKRAHLEVQRTRQQVVHGTVYQAHVHLHVQAQLMSEVSRPPECFR